MAEELNGTIVQGAGPVPSRLMIIGERPGEDEAWEGEPFVGKSGQEQNRYLGKFGVRPGSYFKTNICKDYMHGNPDPTHADIKRHIPALAEELICVQPEIIGTVGRFATRFFLRSAYMEQVHGMSYWVSFSNWEGWVVPIYHPAAGLYNNDLQPVINWDYKKLAGYLHGDIPLRHAQDEFPDPVYEDLTSAAEVDHQLHQWDGQPIAVDTEGWRHNPWGLSFSWESGTAYVIRYANREAIEAFAAWLKFYKPRLVFHNALHDVEVLEAMGISSSTYTYEDTMIRAYQLQVEPQGLKPLAKRFCGMDQPSYADLIAPYADDQALEYMICLHAEGSFPRSDIRLEFDGGKIVQKKPWSLDRYLKRIFDDLAKGKLDPSELRKRWNKWHVDTRIDAIKQFGDMPEPTLDDVPLDVAVRYSARDADATIRIHPHLKDLTDAMELGESLDTDHAVIPMIELMHRRGLMVDVPLFKKVSDHLLDELLRVHEETEGRLGFFLNLNSSPQLSQIFYDAWEDIPEPPKRTKTGQPSLNEAGLSTIKVNLESLHRMTHTQETAHWLIDQALEYRGLLKLRNTYAEKIPLFVDEHSRLHPNYRVTKVITGRLSAFDPNVLAIPARGRLAHLIKQCFIAPPGYRLGTWDFSGIEMRVMAHLSQDPVMLDVFRKNLDQHSITASMIFGKPVDQIDKKTERFPAKTMGFLIIYGGGPYTLQANLKKEGLDWSVDRCEELINMYLDIHKGVRRFMSKQIASCRRYGLVRSVRGRIRHLPGIWSGEKFVRLEAERAAINFPIQATAQEIIKQAMADALEWSADFPDYHPLLQIHDELLYEFPEDQWETIDPLMVATMENCWELSVPLKVGGDSGRNWAELDK